jgi:hypothetical protein
MFGKSSSSKLLITLAAGVLLGIVYGVPTSAAPGDSSESILMSPAKKNYKFDAGSTKTDEITVINNGDSAYRFKVYASPYSVKNVEYEPDFYTTRKNTDLESWITFSKDTFSIEPNQTIKVPYSIAVPADATPGGHYAVLFAETQPPESTGDTNSVQRKKRIGSLVYATVNGTYQMGGTFKDIRTPGLQFKSPLRSELNVENTGNSDFSVETVFAVSDIFGSRKYTDTKAYQLLPKTERKLVFSWDTSPSFGLYEVTVSAKFLDKQTTKTSYVLMAPLAFYMIFVVGLLVLIIVFVQRRK